MDLMGDEEVNEGKNTEVVYGWSYYIPEIRSVKWRAVRRLRG